MTDMQLPIFNSLMPEMPVVHRRYRWMMALLVGCLLPVSVLTPLVQERANTVNSPLTAVIIKSLLPLARVFRQLNSAKDFSNSRLLNRFSSKAIIVFLISLAQPINCYSLWRRGPPALKSFVCTAKA